MCCGRKRLAQNAPMVQLTGHERHGYPTVRLRYLDNARIAVPGQASGRHYEFSGASPVREVDVRDAKALLGTRFFQRA